MQKRLTDEEIGTFKNTLELLKRPEYVSQKSLESGSQARLVSNNTLYEYYNLLTELTSQRLIDNAFDVEHFNKFIPQKSC